MSEVRTDIINALRRFKAEWLVGSVTLVIGFVIAWVVQFVAFIGIGILLVGSGGKLPMWALQIPVLIASALFMVAIGTVARGLVVDEDGASLREHAWAVVPLGMLATSTGMVIYRVLAFGGGATEPLALGVAIAVSWVFTVAMIDVVVQGSPLGLRAPLTLLAEDTTRAVGNAVASVLIVAIPFVAMTVVFPLGVFLLLPPLAVLQIVVVFECYAASFELPRDRAMRQEVEERPVAKTMRRPSYLGAPSEPSAVEEREPATVSAWATASVDTPTGSDYGTWIGNGSPDGVLYVTGAPVGGRLLVADSAGSWHALAASTSAGIEQVAVPAGPWFVALHGAPAGSSFQWCHLASAEQRHAA